MNAKYYFNALTIVAARQRKLNEMSSESALPIMDVECVVFVQYHTYQATAFSDNVKMKYAYENYK